MFASQLLRILQTIPSDVKYETCVDDSDEQDMTMKDQNETLHGSKSSVREVDPLAFESKEVYQINGLRRDAHPSPFELKGRDECWNPVFVDDLSTDSQKVTRDSALEEFQNGLLYRPCSPEKDEYLLSSVPNAADKVQSSSENECSWAGEEFVHHDEYESRDSRTSYIAASNPFERANNLFDDKIVLECELPDLLICHKELNYHVVKDICVDDGMPVNSKILSHGSEDDQSDYSLSQPLNDDGHCKASEAVHKKFLVLHGLAATSLGNTKSIIANERGNEEENHDILLSLGRPKSPEISFDKDTAKDCDHEDSFQKDETNFSASCKTVTHASEEFFVDRTLPVQEFGTRSFLRSFLNSLDGGESKVIQLPYQISSGKAVSGSCAPSSAETGAMEDVQANNLHYNSKVETGSITFNFNSTEPVLGGITNVRTESGKEQSSDSRESLRHKDTSSENAHDQTLDVKDEIPVLSSSSEVINFHEHRDRDNDAVISLRRYDEGESSFSTSGFINYSGPIAYSGSLSLGSDGSVTSGRSFAFPILQPEWSSSPVRMTKADGRHFRKHKGWRSGLLCCRF